MIERMVRTYHFCQNMARAFRFRFKSTWKRIFRSWMRSQLAIGQCTMHPWEFGSVENRYDQRRRRKDNWTEAQPLLCSIYYVLQIVLKIPSISRKVCVYGPIILSYLPIKSFRLRVESYFHVQVLVGLEVKQRFTQFNLRVHFRCARRNRQIDASFHV